MKHASIEYADSSCIRCSITSGFMICRLAEFGLCEDFELCYIDQQCSDRVLPLDWWTSTMVTFISLPSNFMCNALSHGLRAALQGVQLEPYWPTLKVMPFSYLFFIDDCLLISQAFIRNAACFAFVVKVYCRESS